MSQIFSNFKRQLSLKPLPGTQDLPGTKADEADEDVAAAIELSIKEVGKGPASSPGARNEISLSRDVVQRLVDMEYTQKHSILGSDESQ